MKIEKLLRCTAIHGRNFCRGTVVLYLDNGGIVASADFQHRRNQFLKLWYYTPIEKRWGIVYDKSDITEYLWDYHRGIQRKYKKKKTVLNCERMMKHDRKKKKRANGYISSVKAITDYECAKEPLHDFRRVYI